MNQLSTEIFVLCDHASISQDQKLSIIGVFDQFFLANVPTTWPRMYLVAVVRGEANKELPITLKITPPPKTDLPSEASGEGGAKLPDKEIQIKLGPNGKANLITELVNFPLPNPGVYKVEILSDKKQVGELMFTVNKTTATYNGDQLGKKVVN